VGLAFTRRALRSARSSGDLMRGAGLPLGNGLCFHPIVFLDLFCCAQPGTGRVGRGRAVHPEPGTMSYRPVDSAPP
jgi:hypothetical protein